MNILITGAKGFVGKNLAEALKNIRDGKDQTRPELKIDEISNMGAVRIRIRSLLSAAADRND